MSSDKALNRTNPKLFLREGWYFIRLRCDLICRPAYWNGVVWENRIMVIADSEVAKVLCRVPDHDFIKFNNAMKKKRGEQG